MRGRLELLSTVGMNVAYCLAVAAFLWSMFPGLRGAVLRWLQAQLMTYHSGVWVARWDKLPPHLQEAAEVRGKGPRRPLRRKAA
jgi:hypothetical protein